MCVFYNRSINLTGDNLSILHYFHKSTIKDPAVFAVMYEHNRLSVFRYIYSLIGGSSDDAEDLTAEIFIRAWKARHRFEGDVDSAVGWLLGIARRLVIDDYRRKKISAPLKRLNFWCEFIGCHFHFLQTQGVPLIQVETIL